MIEYILKYKESVVLKNNITITNKSNRDIMLINNSDGIFIEIIGCHVPLELNWVRDNDEISVIDRDNRWQCPKDNKSNKVAIFFDIKDLYDVEYLVERISEQTMQTKVIVE